jgi:hypothetical protein
MSDLSRDSGHNQGITDRLAEAAHDKAPVKGLTHEFYRYPARFSPTFVRAAIETFTQPGDWVIDPFAGGGTTLVEAMALGRNALGIDISSLSSFVCEAKTLILSDQEVSAFERWSAKLDASINMHAPSVRHDGYANAGYYRNLDGPEFWRLRKAIEQALSSIEKLRLKRSETLARCVVLRTAQWALDARRTRPSIPEFKARLSKQAGSMLTAALEFRHQLNELALPALPKAFSVNRSTVGAEDEPSVQAVCPPKLILTSPPYPGIHVLYHRWQVDGRREAPAPFWIAGKLDGAGSSYYTMGDRQNPNLASYFAQLKDAFNSIAAMAGAETTVVQMVAFSERDWQLPKYLEVMEECGLTEAQPWHKAEDDGRLWRDVPGRRWHAQQNARAPGAREVVLVHRKAQA